PSCSALFPYTTLFRSDPAGAVLYRKQERKFHPLRQLLPDDWLWQPPVKSEIGDASGSWCSYRSRIVWRLPAQSGLQSMLRCNSRSEEHTSELQSRENL